MQNLCSRVCLHHCNNVHPVLGLSGGLPIVLCWLRLAIGSMGLIHFLQELRKVTRSLTGIILPSFFRLAFPLNNGQWSRGLELAGVVLAQRHLSLWHVHLRRCLFGSGNIQRAGSSHFAPHASCSITGFSGSYSSPSKRCRSNLP